uniref:Restriction endonuclease n=1 Tax=Meloidogyne hapla TaxID=6305 RepID=A0A1I8BQT9_MELHA
MYKTHSTEWKWKFNNLSHLLVPEDAYKFVRALDQIIIDSAVNKELSPEKDKLSLKIFHKKNSETEGLFLIPIDSLVWVRQTIAKILEEYDGSEELPKLPIVDQPNVTTQKKTNEACLVYKKLRLGKNYNIGIKLEQGKSGKRFIELTEIYKKQNKWKWIDLPKFLVPIDAYKFVRALDRIISACDGEKFFDEKSKDTTKELAFEEIITDIDVNSIVLYRNKEGKLKLKLLLKRKTEYGINTKKFDKFFVPIESLLWIRETTAKILEEHDGSEELPKMPIVDFPVISNR